MTRLMLGMDDRGFMPSRTASSRLTNAERMVLVTVAITVTVTGFYGGEIIFGAGHLSW